MHGVVAGRGEHDVGGREIVAGALDPAVIHEIGEIGFVAFPVQWAHGDEQRIGRGACGHGQRRVGRAGTAAAGHHDHDLAILRQPERGPCGAPVVLIVCAGAQPAGVEGLGTGPVGVVGLLEARVIRCQHAGAGVVGRQMARVAAVAVHADLDRRHAGDAREQGQLGRYVDHEQAAVAVVQMVEDTAHGLTHRREAERHAMHDRRRGLVVQGRRGRRGADHVRQGDDFDIALEAVEQRWIGSEHAHRP